MADLPVYGDPVVICPYNKHHRIAKSRIQTHIVRCEQNYPEGYREICPFDATHRFSKQEMPGHIENCPLKKLCQPELYQSTRNHGADMSDFMSRTDYESMVDVDENWDTESIASSSHIVERVSEANDATPCNQPQFHFERNIDTNERMELRAARGFSQSMMMFAEKPVPLDMESVCSGMGIGRGKPNPSVMQNSNKLNNSVANTN